MSRTKNQDEFGKLAIVLIVALAMVVAVLLPIFSTSSQSPPQPSNLIPGQSATLLADGRWLLVGGESIGGSLNTASIWNPQTGAITQLSAKLTHARSWHTATTLPDGSVLILGGQGPADQLVSVAEVFDPATQMFSLMPATDLSARARHTATLLADGHVVVAGGVDSSGQTLATAELWDALNATPTVQLPGMTAARRSHTATLTDEGKVLFHGGTDHGGQALENGDLYDPSTFNFSQVSLSEIQNLKPANQNPSLVASLPFNDSVDVATDSIIALRFSIPLRVESLNSHSITLSGPRGIEPIKVVPAEGGMLAFITPELDLLPGATYSLTVNGAADRGGVSLPISGISFTTEPPPGAAQATSPALSIPEAGDPKGDMPPQSSKSQSSEGLSQGDKLQSDSETPQSPQAEPPPLIPPATQDALSTPGGCPAPLICGHRENSGGESVDMGSGTLALDNTDMLLPDVIPISLGRTLVTRHNNYSQTFGPGASHTYQMFLYNVEANFATGATLYLPDGTSLSYTCVPTAHCSNPELAQLTHTASPSRFYQSRLEWNGNGWDLTLKDGTVYVFEPHWNFFAHLLAIRDRFGNQLTVTRDSTVSRRVTRVTSPNGRFIQFTYNGASNLITQVTDNIGRSASYTYDASNRLWKVTDTSNGITEYGYDASGQLLTIKNPKGTIVLTNEYYPDGRVMKQTLANTGTYQFAYIVDVNDKVTQSDVTDPHGNVKRITFNSDGFALTKTLALGTPEEQTYIYQRQAGTNRILSETDALNRKTSYTYDSKGNVLTLTRLADTPQAVTTTFTYEPNFSQVTTIKDPLNHTTSLSYDSAGNLIAVEDPLGHRLTSQYNGLGQRTSITDAAGTTQFVYDFADLVSFIDPLGNTTNRELDFVGRLSAVSNPLSQVSRYEYDTRDRLTKVTDALTGETNFAYDPNGNLLGVTDAKSQATIYTHNNMERMDTRKDPLLKVENYVYDNNGNLLQFTDRKNQTTTHTYDALNRRTLVTYQDGSTTGYTYDKSDRLTQINDSVAGVITRTYDGLNRLTSEQTPQGTITYTYDAADRRTTMTVPNQAQVVYTYDNANRLTRMTQGTSTTTFEYDAADRRTSVTLPNGILINYSYDAASRVTGITYKRNGTAFLGDLTYEYDKAGNRTKIGGSWARTGIPEPITTTNYDVNNRQLAFGDQTLTYDDNGNLQSIADSNGTTLYNWNARNQLVSINGPTVSANLVYDGSGRRQKKTINGNLTEFLYDGLNPVQESSGAVILASILPGLGIDEFLMRTDVATGTTSSLLTDHLGSPIAIADNTGTVKTEYSYEAFGRSNVTGVQNSSSYQFTGRENDGTGLYYYRARYYHPALQRFISEDPLGLAGNDVNTYAYVSNNPIIWFDPTGEAKKPGLPKRIECLVYYARVQSYCSNNRCEDDDSCLMLILKISIKRACITAQKHLTEECYPDNPTHKQRIPDQLKGIKRCETLLADKNCNSCPAQ